MTSADLLARLWALAMLYPAQAMLLALALWMLAVLVGLAVLSMLRPELPLHQWEDDDDQHRAVTRPAGLQPSITWRRSGGVWWLK